MKSCDAIFEYICTASVRPDTNIHGREFLVISFAPDPGSLDFPDTILVFTKPNNLQDIEIIKLTNAIYYFICKYKILDENKINFLLWYTDMLCKKLDNKISTGLKCEGVTWTVASSESRFLVGPYRTKFFVLHIFDEGCFNTQELYALREVGNNFTYFCSEDAEIKPEFEGGERELSVW